MIKKQIEKTIDDNNLIEKGDHVVLGLSGGPDSVCLFHVLYQLAKERGFILYAVHVNHMFRPGAAEEDQSYVEDLCEKKGIRCFSFTRDCNMVAEEKGISLEEAGREVRYDAFRQVVAQLVETGNEQDKVKVAVAQNYNDQAETLIIRLIRGTGPDGLAGMDYMRKDGERTIIIRPLLDVKRTDIEEHCEKNHLMPRIDKTNLEPLYVRNKIRLELIPFIDRQFGCDITTGLNRLADIAREDKECLGEITDDLADNAIVSRGDEQIITDRNVLKSGNRAIVSRVVIKIFEMIGLDRDISRRNLIDGLKIIKDENPSGQIDFPGGYRIRSQYDKVVFEKVKGDAKGSKRVTLSVFFAEGPQLVRERGKMCFDKDVLEEDLGTVLDKDSIVLRNRKPGDKMSLGPGKGRKKLQDIFVDDKIPKVNRDNVKLVCIGHMVLWIVKDEKNGVKKHRTAGRYKIKEDTKNVLILEITC